MNIEQLRIYCLAKPHTSEDFPFDNKTLVFRVGGKLFALTSIVEETKTVNLKCDPERALELRDEYPELITPGYHMDKKHWNTVNYMELPTSLMHEMIDHSYDLVTQTLTKQKRKDLGIED